MQVYSSFNPKKQKNYYKKPYHKTKGFYLLFIIFILLTIFVFWSIKSEPATQTTDLQDETPQTDETLTVNYVNGVLEKKDEDWITLKTNDQIHIGETIKTGSDTKAIIQFSDGSLIRLGSNTEIKILELGQGEIIIDQIAGIAYHRINENSPAIYRVQHETVEFTALGTGFNVNVLGNILKVAVIESRIKIRIFETAQFDNAISMRTVDEGYVAIVDRTKKESAMIESEQKEISVLLNDEWLVWNKDEDQKLDLYLGVFASNVQLNITEPSKIESKTSIEKATIKGTTDPEADIYILGHEIENKDGEFEYQVLLAEGENIIEIVVKKGKKMNKQVLYIDSDQSSEPLTLEINTSDDKALLNWTIKDNIEHEESYQIIKSTSKNFSPESLEVETVTTNSYEWKVEDGIYYFKVCFDQDELKGICSEIQEAVMGNVADDEISLTGKLSANDIILNWTYTNPKTESFKVVINTDTNPTFPTHSSHSISKNSLTDTWKGLEPDTYYFRVCAIVDSECLLYSDNHKIVIEEPASGPGNINLSGTAGTKQASLNWSLSNLESPKGYKILMSEDATPVFPGSEFKLATSESDLSLDWTQLTTGKTYHFKVCQNFGSSCGIISNEISLTIK